MDSLGVNNKKLSQLVYSLREEPEIKASKISGSGLGDCVYGIGKISEEFPYKTDTVKINNQGLICL